MALVDWSSAAQCGCWGGATTTSRVPLVRPGSNIMLRLLTLTCSQPGYRLLMLTEPAGGEEAVRPRPGRRVCVRPSYLAMPCPFLGHSLVPTPYWAVWTPPVCYAAAVQGCCLDSFWLLHLPHPLPELL